MKCLYQKHPITLVILHVFLHKLRSCELPALSSRLLCVLESTQLPHGPYLEVLSAIACCQGLCEASLKYLRSTVRVCLPVCFPWCTSPSPAWRRQWKRPLFLSLWGMLHAALTQSGRNDSLYTPWNVFESIISVWINAALEQTLIFSLLVANVLHVLERKGNKILHSKKLEDNRQYRQYYNTSFYANAMLIFHF